MSRPNRTHAVAVALALAVTTLATGCSSGTPPARPCRAGCPARTAGYIPGYPVGTWAVTVMGGSAAQHNDFWQMFICPAGSSRWQLVTPPGAADNGGLVLTASDGPSLVTGFRPSQNLTFTPLIETSDGRAAVVVTQPARRRPGRHPRRPGHQAGQRKPARSAG